MKRVTGHRERWGEFVDVKVNAADLLQVEARRKRRKGRAWVSGVCDPYQPLEARYNLTLPQHQRGTRLNDYRISRSVSRSRLQMTASGSFSSPACRPWATG